MNIFVKYLNLVYNIVYQTFKEFVTSMRPSEALSLHRESIRKIIADNKTENPRIFGSVVNGTDTSDSDLDILVDATPNTTLMDIGNIRHKLLNLLKVPVDVLTPKALPDDIRAKIMLEAIPL